MESIEIFNNTEEDDFMDYDILTYKRNRSPFNSGEPQEITFKVSSDIDIYEFKTMCMRLAFALGYNENSIKKGFGEIKDKYYDDEIDLTFNDNIN